MTAGEGESGAMARRREAILGCLLGTAVGDALGLPAEGLSRLRQRKLLPDLERFHLIGRRGMVSDDTEHTCMTAQALLVSAGEVAAFRPALARQLQGWLLGAPAGIGLATLKAILRLWAGVPPERSGVFSAGNGPAMRSALLGVCYGEDSERLRALVRASSRLTHTDPKAETGAMAVALAAHCAARGAVSPEAYLALLRSALGSEGEEMTLLAARAADSARAGQETEAFADSLGLKRGVSGYVYHTVPIALHAWLRHPRDYRAATQAVIRCGGDTDSTAAIVGGIAGAEVGRGGIPADWLSDLWEWPRSIAWMETLACRLAEVVESGKPQQALPISTPALLARNAVFLAVILAHGFRRLLPPY